MNLLEKVQRLAASPSLEYEQKITVIAYNLAENRCENTQDLVGCIAHVFPDMQRDLMKGIGIQVDGHVVSKVGGTVVVSKIEPEKYKTRTM
jgi:hypothetical protein